MDPSGATMDLDDICVEVLDVATVAMLRAKSPAERVQMVGACHRTCRQLLAGHFQTTHPEWSMAEIQVAVSRRLGGGTA